jgi:hypothetical protein
MATPTLRLHTNAVIAALEADGLTVGDATGEGLSAPYVVVYRISGTRDGEADAPDDRAELVFQLTCVGTGRQQAEWVQDKAEAALRSIAVAGRSVRLYVDSDGPVSRDDDAPIPLFYSTPRYRLWTTPS